MKQSILALAMMILVSGWAQAKDNLESVNSEAGHGKRGHRHSVLRLLPWRHHGKGKHRGDRGNHHHRGEKDKSKSDTK